MGILRQNWSLMLWCNIFMVFGNIMQQKHIKLDSKEMWPRILHLCVKCTKLMYFHHAIGHVDWLIDWVLYKHQRRLPISKNTTPMYTCLMNCIIMLAFCCVAPMSICPIFNNNLCVYHSLGWVCYAEKSHGEYILPHISNVKSPQQIMGSIVKVWYEMLCNYEVECVRSFFWILKVVVGPLAV